jgi:PAS domain-containing protein
MRAPKAESSPLAKLRQDAEHHLKEGSAPRSAGWSVGVNALSLLHDLASRPDSAVDALKLLHELQVYQIELDLQHEQIETAQRDLWEDLKGYRELFDDAPVAYLKLSHQHVIIDCNEHGAQLFDVNLEEMLGRTLDSLIEPATRPMLAQLLQRLRPDGATGSCEVQLKSGRARHKMQVVAGADHGGTSFLVVLVDLPARR